MRDDDNDAWDEGEPMRKRRWIVAFGLLFLGGMLCGVAFSSGLLLHETAPPALGMGQAYTARAHGPLSPLWNPAAIGDRPGLHGALAVSFSSEAEGALFAGGSLVGSQGLSFGLVVAQGKDAGQGGGTVAFRLLPGVFIGAGLASVTQTDSQGLSFNAGVLAQAETWSAGVGLYHLDGGILGVDRPLLIRVGASFRVGDDSQVSVDLHLEAGEGEVALGVETRVWALDLHWGASVSLHGELSHTGLGIGFILFGFPADLGIGFVGADQKLWISLGVQGTVPLW